MADLGYRPANYDRLINVDGRCQSTADTRQGYVLAYSPAVAGYLVEWDDGTQDWVSPATIVPLSRDTEDTGNRCVAR